MFSKYFKWPGRKFTAVHLTNSDPLSAPGGLEKYTLESARFAEKELGISTKIIFPGSAESAEDARIHSVHLQHSMNWEFETLYRLCTDLTRRTELSRVYLHDFRFACRQHNLLYNDETFCGPPEDIVRGLCASCRYGADVGSQRAQSRKLFELFSLVVAPSETAKRIFCRAFPELQEKVEIVPHRILGEMTVENQRAAKPDEKIAILFPGACGYGKGIDHYAALIDSLGARFRWVTIGIEDRFKDNPLVEHRHHNTHEQPDLTPVLNELKPAVAFLGSIVPETFSFSLHEMLAAGIPVLTTPESGNIGARVAKLECGKVFRSHDEMKLELMNDGEQILRRLVETARRYTVAVNTDGLRRLYG